MGTEGQAIGKGCRLWVDQDPTPSEQTESKRPLESGLPFVLSSHSLPLSIWSCNRNKTWQDKVQQFSHHFLVHLRKAL